MKFILETPRLLLREFTPEDGPLIFTLNSDPDVLKYVHELPPVSVDDAQRSIIERIIPQYIQNGYGRWALFIKDTNEFIGWCGLKYRPERNEIDLGYRLIKTAWGKGYATEAAKASIVYGFEKLHIRELFACAHINHTASHHILEKCGMQFRGMEEIEQQPVKAYTLANPANH